MCPPASAAPANATAAKAAMSLILFMAWFLSSLPRKPILALTQRQDDPSEVSDKRFRDGDSGATRYLCIGDSLCMTYAGMFAWRWRASTNLGRAANRAMRDLNHRLAAGPQASPAPSSSLCSNPAGSAARQDTNAAQGRTRTRLLRRLHEYGGL